ncbi:XRE family transcriptional regulator [Limnovirga soli]|uniref:Helix-turn-helix domain-containing protein n=1 Tax=Limnovirga soli TaxID=2656915 RepID=A0A8J8FAS5_9BACT|nr:helix-turn-helix domain-containing protein [Limnovirga soli]NNV54568.1 helix-turn-helix domain-containing protein [Limnovirga soli]
MPNFFPSNLNYLRKQKQLTQDEAATALGLKRNTFSNYETGHSEPDIATIITIATYFSVDLSNLLEIDLKEVRFNGSGFSSKKVEKGKDSGKVWGKVEPQQHHFNEEMAVYSRIPKVITIDSHGNDNMVMVPVKARAGYLLGYGDTEFIQTLPTYRLPGFTNGTFRLFESQGLSMYPTFNDRDILVTQFVEKINEIRDDRVYVIVTRTDGVVVKRCLNRIKTDNKLILKSDNIKHREEYPNIIVPPEDILEVWYAIAYMSRQMRSPSEMYTRMIDLEARLTILEQSGPKK